MFDIVLHDQSSVFNVFKSAIAYDTSIKTLPNIAKEGGEEHMVEYEFEPDTKEEVMQVIYPNLTYPTCATPNPANGTVYFFILS